MKRYWKDEKGSVMLEFCLVLPIYLLLFGGTFLMFDITMGRLHLQEANRNLAWIQNDRYDSGTLINQELYKRSVDYFEARNRLENLMEYSDPVWADPDKYIAERMNVENSCPEPPKWAHSIPEFKDGKSGLKINGSLAHNIASKFPVLRDFLSSLFNNEYLEMYSGNMPIEMANVSGVYRGAVGVSSVLFPVQGHDGKPIDLYNKAYTLTRAQVAIDDKGNTSGEVACACCGKAFHVYDGENADGIKNEVRPATVNNEMLILRRRGNTEDRRVNLTGGYIDFMKVMLRDWPVGNSIAANVLLLFGVQL